MTTKQLKHDFNSLPDEQKRMVLMELKVALLELRIELLELKVELKELR